MQNPSRPLYTFDPFTVPYGSMPARSDLAVWSYADLDLVRTTSANVLLVGPDRLVADLVRVLEPDLNPAVTIRPKGGRLPLPQVSATLETVVIWDVDMLTTEGQRALFEWLDAAQGRTRVISIVSTPLLPRIEMGAFAPALYYRLNKIYVDLLK